MASEIKRGESLLIPFRNGKSIYDSQRKPRMYKTMQAFEKSFPGHYLGTDGVELVEYAEVVHGRWIRPTKINGRSFNIFHCSVCNGVPPGVDENTKYCAHCGAKMIGDTNG